MKMNYLIFAMVFTLLSVGCSDKKDISQNFVKERNKVTADEKNKQKILDISIPKKERPISDTRKKENKIIEHCKGAPQCVCDSIPDILSYEFNGERIRCSRDLR